jgi:ComF family protein
MLNLIFPALCENCKNLFSFQTQNFFCNSCISEIKYSKTVYCPSCGAKTLQCERCLKERFYNDIRVFTSYSECIKKIITTYKFNKAKSLSKILAKIIEKDFLEYLEEKEIDTVIPVPLHKKTLRERGFNHLTEILKNIIPVYMINEKLIKIKNTKFQMELSKDERSINLKGAFKLEEKINGKNILIFDDVLTTGSTIMEIYDTLKSEDIKNIYSYIITKS